MGRVGTCNQRLVASFVLLCGRQCVFSIVYMEPFRAISPSSTFKENQSSGKYISLRFERFQALSGILMTSSMPMVLKDNVQFLHFCGNFSHILSHYLQWSVLQHREKKNKSYFSFSLSCLSMFLLVFCLLLTATKVLRWNFLMIKVLSGILGHRFLYRTKNSSEQCHWKIYNRSRHTYLFSYIFIFQNTIT